MTSSTQDTLGSDSPRQTAHGGDASRVFGHELLDMAPRIMRLEAHRLSKLQTPLTHRQYRILQRVSEGITSPTSISRRANISLAAISESVEALARRGLITREQDTVDRRASRLGLTPEGRRVLRKAEKVRDQLIRDLAQDVSARALRSMLRALAQVADNVQRQHDQMNGERHRT